MGLAGLLKDFLGALRAHPSLGPLLLVNVLSSFTTGLLLPVLPLFLMGRGLSFVELGLSFSLVSLGAMVVQVLAGRNPGLFARKEVIAGLLLVSMLSFPAYLFVTSVPGIVAVGAVSSLAGAAAGPGVSLFLATKAPAEARATFFSYLGTVASFAYATAVLSGGLLLALGYLWVFYVGALSALVSFLAVAALLLRSDDAPLPWLRIRDPALRAAARDLARHDARLARDAARLGAALPVPPRALANARWAAAHAFLFGAALAVYPVYLPLFLQRHGLPIHWVGAVVAASWVTYGLCQPFGARYADRTGRHRAIIVASLVVAALLNLAMGLASLPWVIVAWVLLGIADGVGRPLTSALVVTCTQGAAQANAFGLMAATETAARIVAPLALALLIQSQGLGPAFLAVGLVFLVSIVPLLLVRDIAAPPAPAAPALPQGGAA